MTGASLGVALWAVLGFFNGIARPQITLAVNLGVAVLNALLNQLLIVELGFGIAGSAWATTIALGFGVIAALVIFLSPAFIASSSRGLPGTCTLEDCYLN